MPNLFDRSLIVKTWNFLPKSTLLAPPFRKAGLSFQESVRPLISKPNGAMLPPPLRNPLSLVGFGGTVLVGLTLGATISKHIASFLEENDLFVPADDDDDD